MRIIQQRYYSKPSNLERYANPSDIEISRMSRGDKLRLLDAEADKAERNKERYKKKSMKKHAIIGGVGMGLLGLGASGGHLGAGIVDAAIGAGIGAAIGHHRGKNKAMDAGHDPDEITGNLADRFNRYAKDHRRPDDDY